MGHLHEKGWSDEGFGHPVIDLHMDAALLHFPCVGPGDRVAAGRAPSLAAFKSL